MKLGSIEIPGKVFLAPMAGITDLPFRLMCRKFGASYAVGEMAASKADLQDTEKTRLRYVFDGEPEPRAVQLLGADPAALAAAARKAVSCGAQVVDLNCGCPARKVCSVACGSYLLKDPELVGRLLEAIVAAVDVPVTLKFRTGWDDEHINAPEVAKIAEEAGASMLVLHGRTRTQGYKGEAEYETIRKVKAASGIPVIANGDIGDIEKAKAVMYYTLADGIMIGRAAFGNPWIFRELENGLAGRPCPRPSQEERLETILEHQELHVRFYGEPKGVRTFRKHLNWYLAPLHPDKSDMDILNQAVTTDTQRAEIERLFNKYRNS